MKQLQKYTWLIDTIRRAGKITHKELSSRWERCKELSDCRPLHRATFNRWRDAIFSEFGIIIDCQRAGGNQYYIANPEDIDENELKKWMIDSFSVSNLIGENLALKNRIIVDPIPSGHNHLTAVLNAMKDNSVITIGYKAFNYNRPYPVTIEPLCLKLYENRWYLLGHNLSLDTMRIYGLDRIESVTVTDAKFKLPKGFSGADFFSGYYGIVVDNESRPERIVIRAGSNYVPYLKTLPLHHSQMIIEERADHADIQLYLIPTYDFVMKLLQIGPQIEVVAPQSLRQTVRNAIEMMQNIYASDEKPVSR